MHPQASSNRVPQSSAGRRILNVVGALVVVIAAFWATIKILDYWSTPVATGGTASSGGTTATSGPDMQVPTYDAASLPHLTAGGPGASFEKGQNKGAFISGWLVQPPGAWT